jgi:4'-phosphopantetheinyl transferase
MTSAPAPRTCLVWWATRAAAHPRLTRLLDPHERLRYDRFRNRADADRMLVGVALAKTLAGHSLGVPPQALVLDRTCAGCGAPHGKPRLPGLQLSVAHAGDRIVVAVSGDAAVGVDVEPVDGASVLLDSPGAVLTPRELAGWQALDPERRPAALTAVWVWKESVLKATGDGLSVPLNRLGIDLGPDGDRPALREWSAAPPRPPARLFPLALGDGYVAGLTVLDADCCLVLQQDVSWLLSPG